MHFFFFDNNGMTGQIRGDTVQLIKILYRNSLKFLWWKDIFKVSNIRSEQSFRNVTDNYKNELEVNASLNLVIFSRSPYTWSFHCLLSE